MSTSALNKRINKIKYFFSDVPNIIIVIFGIFLTIGVIYPLFSMVMDSFTVQSISEAKNINEIWDVSVKRGDFSLLQWPSLLFNKLTPLYSKNFFWIPLYRSVLMALIACTVSVTLGGTLAFLITRTDIPFKKFISAVFVFPYIMPSWSIAMFWENFFKNTNVSGSPGVGLLQALTGICVPQWALYGLFPTAIVLGLHYAPFAYILIGGILRNMDANLEEAATILKTSRFKIIRRITLPIVAPAMISTILLVFASSISSYTVPQFLNKDGSFNSISITLRSALMTGKKGEGYVIATVLLVFSVLILTLNNSITKSRRSFTTVSGKSGQISKINLKKAKWPITFIMIILVTFFAVIPLFSFILETLEETSGDFSSITLKYWISSTPAIDDAFVGARDYSLNGIFYNDTILKSFARSIVVAVIVSFICGTCGILIGYAVSKHKRSKLANYVSSLAFLPYLIPALSFSTIFFSLSKTSTFHFLDVATTLSEWSAVALCIIVGGIKFLPFASRSGTNAMFQVSGEIEEAAIITGCPWWKRMTKILFPIQKSSFISGYLLPFISCMREYTLFALITSSVTLATNVLEYYTRNGVDQLANGINLLLVVFVIAVNLMVNKLTGASIDKGIGG
ncbi:iron ABC transporter permease [Treponema sp. OMZ 840]|uniref:ABC transporter permease n=1 Tax=Treponema sp. OMZ 840 TaxID=244313 RepID=UPI003D89B9C0